MAAALHSVMLLTGPPFAAGLGIIVFFSAAPQEVNFPVQCSKWNCFGLPKTHELLLAEQGSSASIHPRRTPWARAQGMGGRTIQHPMDSGHSHWGSKHGADITKVCVVGGKNASRSLGSPA